MDRFPPMSTLCGGTQRSPGSSPRRCLVAYSLLLQSADGERPNLGDTVEVAVHVNNTKAMVQSCRRDQQIRYRRPVPHAMVMSQIPLQRERAGQNIGRSVDRFEARVQVCL